MTDMTVQDMRDYVRDFLDTDSTELSDTLLDVWRREATARIERSFETWDFFEQSWTLTTSAASTALTSIDSTCERVISVEGDNWLLEYIPHERAVAKYAFGGTSSQPTEWSVWGNALYLWPTPDGSASYTVRGYRSPTEATLPSDTVDLPAEFHPLIAEWMLARAYERNDDDVMSQQKFSMFAAELETLRTRYTRATSPGIMVIGASSPVWPTRMRYDWEF